MVLAKKDISFSKRLENGKPSERVGRKATGLNPVTGDTAAGLPGHDLLSYCMSLSQFTCPSPFSFSHIK
jgi:hypothetical protein